MKKIVYIIVMLVILTSCGARKSSSSTQDIKIEETTKVTEEVSQVSEKNETLIDTTSVIEEEFTPIDSTKEMVIDKKNGIFKNARYKTSKTKKGITTAKKEESVLNQRKDTLNQTSADINTKDKQADRKESFGSWIWLLIIVGLVLGYLEYRRK